MYQIWKETLLPNPSLSSHGNIRGVKEMQLPNSSSILGNITITAAAKEVPLPILSLLDHGMIIIASGVKEIPLPNLSLLSLVGLTVTYVVKEVPLTSLGLLNRGNISVRHNATT